MSKQSINCPTCVGGRSLGGACHLPCKRKRVGGYWNRCAKHCKRQELVSRSPKPIPLSPLHSHDPFNDLCTDEATTFRPPVISSSARSRRRLTSSARSRGLLTAANKRDESTLSIPRNNPTQDNNLSKLKAYIRLPILVPDVVQVAHANGSYSSVGFVHAHDARNLNPVFGAYKIANTSRKSNYAAATADHARELKILQYMHTQPYTHNAVVQPIGRFSYHFVTAGSDVLRIRANMGSRRTTEFAIVYQPVLPLSLLLHESTPHHLLNVSNSVITQWRRPHRVDLRHTKNNLADIVHAVARIHRSGVAHFDLKPHNIAIVPHLSSRSTSTYSRADTTQLVQVATRNAPTITPSQLIHVDGHHADVIDTTCCARILDWGFAHHFNDNQASSMRSWQTFGTRFFTANYFISSGSAFCASSQPAQLAYAMDYFALTQTILCIMAGTNSPDLGAEQDAKRAMLAYGNQFCLTASNKMDTAGRPYADCTRYSWIEFAFDHTTEQCISLSHHASFCASLRRRAPLTGALSTIWQAIMVNMDYTVYWTGAGGIAPSRVCDAPLTAVEMALREM
jgi:hypothetical protein